MTQVIVDDVALREPNLLVPRKSPVGLVKINWSNPITRGLEDCFILQNIHSNSLAGTRKIISIGGTPTTDRGGIGFTLANSEYLQYDTTNMYTGYPRTQFGVAYVREDGLGSAIVFSQANASLANHYFALYVGETSFNYIHRGGSNTAAGFLDTGGTPIVNEINTVAGVSFAANKHHVFGNGVKLTTNTNTQTPANLDRYNIGAVRDSTPSYGGKVVYCSMLFSRALSDSEIKSLHDDPYQFLKPVSQVSDLAFIGTAAEAPTAPTLFMRAHGA